LTERHLAFSTGCFNARDLGGLRTQDGRAIRRGAVVRSDALDALDASGWDAVRAHGIRTILDLRNDDELAPHARERAGITTLHLPIDEVEDTAFWIEMNSDWRCGTPLYYLPHVRRFPKRSARVVSAILHAEEGGVLFHCGIGRDRTGLVTMLLLAMLGVAAEDIADDYELSVPRLRPLFAQRGEPDQGPLVDAFLASRGTTLRRVVLGTLAALDLDAWMRAGGLDARDRAALRARLLSE
jgi:protein tyrosine/serine phosphatase